MRAGGDAAGFWRILVPLCVTEVAGHGLGLSQPEVMGRRIRRIGFRRRIVFIRHHEDAAIRAIIGAETASNAVVFNDDLEMFSSVNGVHRTAHHTMSLNTGAARSGHHEVAQTHSVPKQTTDRHSVGMSPMLLHAALGALVTANTQIHVQGQNAAPLVKSLTYVIVHDGIHLTVPLQKTERTLN